MSYFPRRLRVHLDDGTTKDYTEEEFFAIEAPLIITGEQGCGKSEIVKQYAKKSCNDRIPASIATSLPYPINPAKAGTRVIIDGLDEIKSPVTGAPVLEIMSKLAPDNDTFILTCRALDWKNAFSSEAISLRSGKKPIVGSVIPFTNEEIISFVDAYGNGITGKAFLEEAEKRDVTDLLRNPQTLEMYLTVVKKNGGWPKSKSQLFEEFCDILVVERDSGRRSKESGSQATKEELLDAAAFIFAQLILSDKQLVNVDGDSSEEAPGIEHLKSTKYTPDIIRSVLSTRLFKSCKLDALEAHHRTVAEYLAAKHVGALLNNSLSLSKFDGILYGEAHTVPSSLRGFHAWLAIHARRFTKQLISFDPFGFYKYGDLSALTIQQAKDLLSDLQALAVKDRLFYNQFSSVPFGRDLARKELKKDIVSLISSPQVPYQFSALLIDSLAGTEFIKTVINDLISIALNPKKSMMERHAVVDALGNEAVDWKSLASKLNLLDDFESQRLAVSIVEDKLDQFTGTEIGEIASRFFATKKSSGSSLVGSGWRLRKTIAIEQIPNTLDSLIKLLPPAKGYSDGSENRDVEEWIYTFLARHLELDPDVKAENVWRWLKQTSGRGYHTNEWDKISAKIFSSKVDLKRKIQSIAIGELKSADDLWMLCIHRIPELSQGLYFTEDDIIYHLNNLVENANKPKDWLIRWDTLVRFLYIHTDYKGDGKCFVAEQAAKHPELRKILDEHEKPREEHPEVAKWKLKDIEAKAEQLAEESKRHANFTKYTKDLENGEPLQAVYNIANAATAGFADIRGTNPEERIKHLVGDENLAVALSSMEKCLIAAELPSPADIFKLHAQSKKSYYETIALAYCGQLYEQGNLSLASQKIKVVALAACNWGAFYPSDKLSPEVKKQLELFLLSDPEIKEQFARDSIEPFLELGEEAKLTPSGLYTIMNEPRFSDIAGRLAIEWLTKYPNITNYNQKLLVHAALRHSPSQLEGLIETKMAADRWKDNDDKGLWYSVAFVLQPKKYEEQIKAFATERPENFWVFRDVIKPRDSNSNWPNPAPIHKLFLLNTFLSSWPVVSMPSSGWGDQNPYTAYIFLSEIITSLSKDLTDEVTAFFTSAVSRPELATYHDLLSHFQIVHLRLKAENQQLVTKLSDVRHILLDEAPKTPLAIQNLIVEKLKFVEDQIRNGSTKALEAYWENDEPRSEPYCRNRIVDALTPLLANYGVTILPEGQMPDDCRCDVLGIKDTSQLPMEFKGQWHPEIWTASDSQLQAKYAKYYLADGRGIYVALWFGKVARSNPPRIDGQAAPKSAAEFKRMLDAYDQRELSSLTTTVVLDLSPSSQMIEQFAKRKSAKLALATNTLPTKVMGSKKGKPVNKKAKPAK